MYGWSGSYREPERRALPYPGITELYGTKEGRRFAVLFMKKTEAGFPLPTALRIFCFCAYRLFLAKLLHGLVDQLAVGLSFQFRHYGFHDLAHIFRGEYIREFLLKKGGDFFF